MGLGETTQLYEGQGLKILRSRNTMIMIALRRAWVPSLVTAAHGAYRNIYSSANSVSNMVVEALHRSKSSGEASRLASFCSYITVRSLRLILQEATWMDVHIGRYIITRSTATRKLHEHAQRALISRHDFPTELSGQLSILISHH